MAAPRLTQLKKKELSRTKVVLFQECPLCFWMDIRHGIKRVSGPSFSLNIAVDALLKAEFDAYRYRQEPHPLFASVGLNAVPLIHAELDNWRHNFTGVRWTDPTTGWTLYGAVDDLWLDRDSWEVMTADYKATAKAAEVTAEGLYPGYRKQQEVYQFLLRRNGLKVSNRGWFYYVNGISAKPQFDNALQFRASLIDYVGDDGWVADTFRAAVATAESDIAPLSGCDCVWCAMRERAAELVWKRTQISLSAPLSLLPAKALTPREAEEAPPPVAKKARRKRVPALEWSLMRPLADGRTEVLASSAVVP